MKKRILVSAALCAAIAASMALGACSSSQSAASVQDLSKVTPAKEIVFWSTKSDALKTQTDAFTQKTGITVKGTYMGGYDDMLNKVMAGIAANNIPDVAQLGQRTGLAQLYDSGHLIPVDSVLPKSLIGDILPGFWKRFTYKDKKVIVPFQNSMPMLYYNKDLLAKAGLTPPSTMDEVVADAKALTTADHYGFTTNSDTPWYIIAMMSNAQVTPISGKTSHFNTPAVQQIFGYYKQMVTDKSMAANQHSTAEEDFANGKVAMILTSCASYATITTNTKQRFAIGIADFPSIKTMNIPMGGNGLGIFKSTAAKEAASVQFVESLLDAQQVANYSLKSGYIPVTNASVSTDTYKKYLEDPNRAIVNDQLKDLGGYGVNPADALEWDDLSKLLDKVEADPNTDISAGLKQIDTDITHYLKDYKH